MYMYEGTGELSQPILYTILAGFIRVGCLGISVSPGMTLCLLGGYSNHSKLG